MSSSAHCLLTGTTSTSTFSPLKTVTSPPLIIYPVSRDHELGTSFSLKPFSIRPSFPSSCGASLSPITFHLLPQLMWGPCMFGGITASHCILTLHVRDMSAPRSPKYPCGLAVFLVEIFPVLNLFWLPVRLPGHFLTPSPASSVSKMPVGKTGGDGRWGEGFRK